MKSLMPQIDSNDGLFHNGNPATGEQGTRVTDTWLNNLQDRVRDVQAEAHCVLQKAGFQPVENKQTQLYEAIVKIIDDNRKKASTKQKGEVQLYSDYDSDSEELAATPKAIKTLKGFIDSITRSLTNYIPNSKKSSEVNSTSADTVATSAAVKTAYDKGVAANNNAEGRISKSGDILTGILYSVGISSKHFGYGAYANQYTSGAPFMVETTGSQDRDTYHPFVKGLVRSKGHYGAGFSFGYTTKQGQGDGFGRGIIHLIEDNGKNITWNFEHNGDFIASGDVRTGSRSLNKTHQTDFNYVTVKQSGNYAGLNIDRQDGKHARFELVGYHFKLWVEDRYEINFPERGGTVLLDTDFSYQKIGNFEVRKYPDGTMIQTYAVNVEEHQLTTNKLKTFNWAVAFASTPMIWVTANATDNRNGAQVDLGALVGIVLSDCTQATCAYRTSEIWQDRNHNPTMQFLAIGRWK